jgi:hypothetical protein
MLFQLFDKTLGPVTGMLDIIFSVLRLARPGSSAHLVLQHAGESVRA